MPPAEETVPRAEETAPPAQETVPPAEETELPAEETETELPAEAAGSKSPAEVAEVPEVAETPAEEKPLGIFKDIDPVAHQQKQKELQEKIFADIEERRAKIENERMAQPDASKFAPPEKPEDPEKTALDKAAPFNAFGGTASAQLAVKEEADSSEENDFCVQDLRLCTACKTKSYIHQGLCINI